jgi:hypothetical protein
VASIGIMNKFRLVERELSGDLDGRGWRGEAQDRLENIYMTALLTGVAWLLDDG